MACLADVDVARVYHSPKDNLIEGLFAPLLSRATQLRRSTGDVQSTALGLYREPLAELLERNPSPGAIRWLTGARIAPRDIRAIRQRHAYVVDDLPSTLRKGPPAGQEGEWCSRVLATLLDRGFLEWRVALPTTEGVYHEKVALLDDACGHRVLLSGSWNETLAGYTRSVERVDVHRGEEDRERCADASEWFEKVWNGEVPGIRVMPVERAIEEGRTVQAEDEAWSVPPRVNPRMDLWTPELLFLAVQDKVPPDFRDPYVGALLNPLPHQAHIHRRIMSRQPPRFLLADEVGLGKTIEAAMVLSTLVATGHARRILILAPRNVLDQWHQELWEKFQLTSWVFEGGAWRDRYGRPEAPASERMFDRLPGTEPQIVLVSRSLAMRKERFDDLKASSWDLVILDEAHRARSRKEGNRYRANNLLIALNLLAERTKGLLLLTATPVQLALHELYDLLRPLGLPKDWMDREQFRLFIEALADDEPDWRFLFEMASASERLYRPRFSLSQEAFDSDLASGVRFFQGLPTGSEPEGIFQKLLGIIRMSATHEIPDLSEGERRLLKIALYRMSPIYQLTCRTTRDLLRRYKARGLLDVRVPKRELAEPIEVAMEPEEANLYHDVQEEYLRSFYEQYAHAGLPANSVGFVMTIYAKRAASSWAALRRSLERRLKRLEQALEGWHEGGIQRLFGRLALEDLRSEGAGDAEAEVELEGYEDVLAAAAAARHVDSAKARGIAERERARVQDLLDRLNNMHHRQIDSKRSRFLEVTPKIVSCRRGLLVFSQFKDTIDDIADALLPEYGSALAKYHGGGGEIWDGTKWVPVEKSVVEERVKSRRVRVLLATDAASEGLNLQALDAVMNYDLPWNPMRIEQRIGRVDRLDQLSEIVYAYVVLPRATVEETVYERCVRRIGLFQESLGPLQPILIEEYVARALLAGKDVGVEVDRAIDKWSTAREHASLLEQALASLVPGDEWQRSRQVERRTLESLLQGLGFRGDGPLWVRGNLRISLDKLAGGADLLTAAPSNPIFPRLMAEIGPIPQEIQAGGASYRLIKCRNSIVLAVRPSPSSGWYIVKDLTRLDGQGEPQVGSSQAEVVDFVDALEQRRLEGIESMQEAQRRHQRDAWREEVKQRVLIPLVRLFNGDVMRVAGEVGARDGLRQLWDAYCESLASPETCDLVGELSRLSARGVRGRKSNLGLIAAAALDLLNKRP